MQGDGCSIESGWSLGVRVPALRRMMGAISGAEVGERVSPG